MTKEDLNDLRLLNEALEDALIVLERLRQDDRMGPDLWPLAQKTSVTAVAQWVYAVYDAKRLGRSLEKAVRASVQNAERGA